MFSKEFKIYFNQVDAAGILYFAEIFPLIHKTYEELFNNFKLSVNHFDNNEYIAPIIHAEADYLTPIRLHEKILVKVRVSRLEKSSFELSYSVEGETGRLRVKAKTAHVLVDKNNFNKIEIPEELRVKLNAFLKE